MDDAATTAFRRAAPFAVLSVAPGLAAKYVSRARLLSPSCTFPDSCPKCGTYLFDGSGVIRVVCPPKRGNKSHPQRALRRLCLVCRKSSFVYLPCPSATITPPPRPGSVDQPSPNMPSDRPMSSFVPTRPPLNPANAQAAAPGSQLHNKRPVQRAGLRQLLSRNKKKRKERERQPADDTASGLAAFLKAL